MKIFTEENKTMYVVVGMTSLIIGIVATISVFWFFTNYRLRSPFQNPIIRRDLTPIIENKSINVIPTTTPTPKVSPAANSKTKTAIVTAYSCGGLTTDEEIDMNCPSLRNHPEGRTATGTTPVPNKTVACDRANLGRTFYLEGIGEVVCEDVGGMIQGSGRFDLYLETVQLARLFGRQNINYHLIK